MQCAGEQGQDLDHPRQVSYQQAHCYFLAVLLIQTMGHDVHSIHGTYTLDIFSANISMLCNDQIELASITISLNFPILSLAFNTHTHLWNVA